MQCRIGCGACCIAPSISTPIPGMPFGKPAGCIQLDEKNRCRLFGSEQRPHICAELQATPDWCGNDAAEAMILIHNLELTTRD